MDYPTKFDAQTTDFPIDRLGTVGQKAWQKLSDQGYEIRVGLTPEYADAIYEMSLQASLKEYVPKDSTERFVDRAATEKWLQKGRVTFLLVKSIQDSQPILVGYGWAGLGGSSHVPQGETTFAIRIGEVGQGNGLATPFARLIISGAAILYGAQNFWLETWESNGGAVHVYRKIGAVDVYQDDSERLLPSGEKIPDTRLYMTLPNGLLNP